MPDPYFSEIRFLGGAAVDFIEVAVDSGTDVSNIQVVVYNPNGTVRTTNTLGTVVDTINGRDVYVIDTANTATFNGLHKNGAIALVENGVVTSFLSFGQVVTATEGPADGTSSTSLGTTIAGESLETSDDGATYQVQTSPNSGTIPCFVSGTMILTDQGERRIEKLSVGDKVVTDDAGLQRIKWIGKRELSVREHLDPAKLPIRLPVGSLARGIPNRTLHVSPNHRMVLHHPLAALYFHADEVLAPAKALVGHRGIGTGPVRAPICYHHILFDRHHIIWANGAPSESLHLARMALEGFDRHAQEEILQAAGHPDAYGPTARTTLKPCEVGLLLNDSQGHDMIASPEPALQKAL